MGLFNNCCFSTRRLMTDVRCVRVQYVYTHANNDNIIYEPAEQTACVQCEWCVQVPGLRLLMSRRGYIIILHHVAVYTIVLSGLFLFHLFSLPRPTTTTIEKENVDLFIIIVFRLTVRKYSTSSTRASRDDTGNKDARTIYPFNSSLITEVTILSHAHRFFADTAVDTFCSLRPLLTSTFLKYFLGKRDGIYDI